MMQEPRTDFAQESCVTRLEHARVVGAYIYFDASFACLHDVNPVLCSVRCRRAQNGVEMQEGFYDVVVKVR